MYRSQKLESGHFNASITIDCRNAHIKQLKSVEDIAINAKENLGKAFHRSDFFST